MSDVRLMQTELAAWAGVAAAAGGLLWIVKGVSILAADTQPDYVFEVAPFFFGVAVIGVALAWERTKPSVHRWVCIVAVLAALAGGVAAIAYVSVGDEGVFGPAVAISSLLTIGILAYTGRGIARSGALGPLSTLPWALFWLYVAAIPLGGLLEGIDGRLLEVPLVAVAAGWMLLGASAVYSPREKPDARPR